MCEWENNATNPDFWCIHLSFFLYKMKRLSWSIYVPCCVTQSCPTLCNPMDCSPPGSAVHGILQARILERVVISFSRGSSQPRDWTQVSLIASGFFTIWATRETLKHLQCFLNLYYLNAIAFSTVLFNIECTEL